MKIYIGSDHRGFNMSHHLIEYLRQNGHEVYDDSDESLNPKDDFPVFARRVVNDMKSSDDKHVRGVLLCGSGQGMCMAANRHKGIRACLGWSVEAAKEARNDDDSNIICFPANSLTSDQAITILETWLKTPFAAAPRYVRRIYEIDNV